MAEGGPTIDADELERAMRAAVPGVFLVPPRIMRRVIRIDRDLPRIGLRVPHRKTYIIAGEALLRIVEREELGLEPDAPPPAIAILIARPDPDILATRGRDASLRQAWRLLFHARAHVALEHRVREGAITPAIVRDRIAQIGAVEFDEVRNVLRHDDLLLPPADHVGTYLEFVAVYLETRAFASHLIPHLFPALGDLDAVDRLIAEDLDAEALLVRSRPAGAPETEVAAAVEDDEEARDDPPRTRRIPRPEQFAHLMARADARASVGNVVRAAIVRARAARVAPSGQVNHAREAARTELSRLADRVLQALGLPDDDTTAWRRALAPLLERATAGVVAVEARLLYDLQKLCVDQERPIYRVSLVDWVLSLGRRPVTRLVPHLKEVLICKHLHVAIRRLPRLRLSARDRDRLSAVLHEALVPAEQRLRDRFRPRIAATLEGAGLVPRNLPERVAREKLVEELLDKVVDRGYLGLGDLRDAFARSPLKLPDLAGPAEFLRGDRLLRADRALAVELDGVYHRGEIYLRWLQRFSALAFGTMLGRVVTKYLALPFGGSFVVLEGLQHIVGPLAHWMAGAEVHLLNPFSFVALSVLALGLLHSQPFRTTFFRAFREAFRLARVLLLDLPAWLLSRPAVRAIIEGRAFAMLARAVLIPAGLTTLSWLLMPRPFRRADAAVALAAAEFAALALLLCSRMGRDLAESVGDGLSWGWRRLRVSILPGLYRFVMDVFERFLEAIDRLLYAVDEWLRFRGGQGRWALLSKAVLGAFWFVITYVVRFFVNLVIEPQVNPIKHFPVVTVSHKVVAPFLLELPKRLSASPLGLSLYTAGGIAFALQFIIPGICGFLVWELKENWRLYQANRPRTLRPVVIGHHGETMARLLRPGFHSGTVPKLFAHLRRAERRASRDGKVAEKYREGLHHVAEAVRHFAERDLARLARESRVLGPLGIVAGDVELATNRLRIELRSGRGEDSLWISFDEQAGWLLAGVSEPGWLEGLDDEERRALANALAGWYAMAGVGLVREQVEATLGTEPAWYDLRPEGVVVGNGSGDDAEGLIPVRLLAPDVSVPWSRWVEVWRRDEEGGGHPESVVDGLRLLPEGSRVV